MTSEGLYSDSLSVILELLDTIIFRGDQLFIFLRQSVIDTEEE